MEAAKLAEVRSAPIPTHWGRALTRGSPRCLSGGQGLSGRALRKLPFQAFASQLGGHKRSVPCLQYCEELCRAVQSEHNRRADVARASK